MYLWHVYGTDTMVALEKQLYIPFDRNVCCNTAGHAF